MFYNLVRDSSGTTLTLIFSDGDSIPVSSDHPRYDEIFEAVQNDSVSEDVVLQMSNVLSHVVDRLTSLSERVSVAGNNLLFDGDPIRSSIADHILRLLREGDDHGWKGLVNFLEKVQTNPNEHSRESLYDWINGRNITITQDGDLIAYKGVRVTGDDENESIFSGKAIVNGVVHSGNIPNPVGGVIEMPRSEVQHDTAVGCSVGLHAGTWDYASNFAQGRVLTVKINPRDVVSVPTDCDAQKMRVSRYEVLSATAQEFSAPTYYEDDEEDSEDEDFLIFCDWCGVPVDDEGDLYDIDGDEVCGSCQADYD